MALVASKAVVGVLERTMEYARDKRGRSVSPTVGWPQPLLGKVRHLKAGL